MGEGEALHLGHRRLLADERSEPLLLQGALDGADAVGPFGMTNRRLVVEAGRMGDVERGHVHS
jgi:hypothetical protein